MKDKYVFTFEDGGLTDCYAVFDKPTTYGEAAKEVAKNGITVKEQSGVVTKVIYPEYDRLKERLRIAEQLLEKLYKQIDEPIIKSPLYTINPSFQQVKCISGFINDASNKELIDKMKLHGWYTDGL